MPTLLDLTSQGDVGTMTDESKLASVVLMDPQQLYELWERQNWQSQVIDFDTGQGGLEGAVRGGPQAGRLEPLVVLRRRGAGHDAVHRARGRLRVPERGGLRDHPAGGRGAPRPALQPLLRAGRRATTARSTTALSAPATTSTRRSSILFDQHLVDACKRLLADPSDVEAKVDFVTTYHMVIEGTLALTGQFYITDWCEKRGPVPRFRRGLQAHLQGRAPARRLWHLVPQGEVRGPGTRPACAGQAGRAPARRRRRVRPAGHAAGRLLRDPRLLIATRSTRIAFTALSRRLKVIGISLPAVEAAA